MIRRYQWINICSYLGLLTLFIMVVALLILPPEAHAEQPSSGLPSMLDWRAHNGNYCPPARDRGDCDSSWAFAAIAALESRYALATNSPGRFIDLAEQILVSCDGGSSGCTGGSAQSAALFLREQGAPPERCFPYVAGAVSCSNACPNWSPRAIKIASFQPITPTIEALKTELQNGPFQVGFDYYADMQFYSGGVYEYTSGKRLAEQSALLVGYADDPGRYGGGYFIALYSFGPHWGEEGYFRIGYSQVGGVVGFGKNAYAYEIPYPNLDNFENDDSRDVARPIGKGETQSHTLQPAFDEDWVVFTTTTQADITLATSGPAGGSTQMWIFDAFGDELNHSDPASTGYARLTLSLPGGVYFAKVAPCSPDEVLTNYSLSLTWATWSEQPPILWLRNYGLKAGGWLSQDKFPRMLGDVNGDGRADIVGFGNDGAHVSLSNGSGFDATKLWIANFGFKAGGWTSQDTYPRTLGDVNNDGKADIVGFGNSGVLVSLSTGNEFSTPTLWIRNYGIKAGGWRSQNTYPRFIADVNGDGRADIVGFGDAGAYVSLSTGASFGPQKLWLRNFATGAGSWTSQDTYPRTLADINNDDQDDIIGFGNLGVYASLSTGNSFAAPQMLLAFYGARSGGWNSQNITPRMVADTSADSKADILGFDEEGVMQSLRSGATFTAPSLCKRAFGVNTGGWIDQNTFPRSIGDLNGDGKADLVGFGNAGVYVALMP